MGYKKAPIGLLTDFSLSRIHAREKETFKGQQATECLKDSGQIKGTRKQDCVVLDTQRGKSDSRDSEGFHQP
jgi:hypothetical protein